MCNRARLSSEPDTLFTTFGAGWAKGISLPNKPLVELYPKAKAFIIREEDERRVLDVMSWGVLPPGQNPGTNVRNLGLASWRRLAERPEQRCLVPVTEFCEWSPAATDLGDGKRPVRGEMWYSVPAQPVFGIGGFWRQMPGGPGWTMVTCAANELVAATHPKAMVTILHQTDWDTWLRGTYDDVVRLQRPFPAELMSVRGPVFPTRVAA